MANQSQTLESAAVEDQLKKLQRKTDDQSAQLASLWDLWEEMMLKDQHTPRKFKLVK